MIAWKFLEPGGKAPFTGFRWPLPDGGPGEWVDAGIVAPCRSGIHACRIRDLPIWMGATLFEMELDGDVVEQERKLVATRGRLLRRVSAWDAELLDAFGGFCRDRTRLRVGYVPGLSAFVGDVDRFRAESRFGLAAFAAARAAELRDGSRAYDQERSAQAAWLAERLGLGRIS